ncbi:MAG: hypothetical protein AAF674_19435 [Pseudomonadota bacterium]
MTSGSSDKARGLTPWQIFGVKIVILCLGILAMWVVGPLLPGHWPEQGKQILLVGVTLGILFWSSFRIERWAAPAQQADPDPRRTRLRWRAMLGGLLIFLALLLTGWLAPLGETVVIVMIFVFSSLVLYRSAHDRARALSTTRAATDERDDLLELRAHRLAEMATIWAVLVIYLVDAFGWMDLTASAVAGILFAVLLATRMFGFLWYEWRMDG